MKHALVTGGSGSTGAAICRRLAQDGCHVYIHANHNLQAAQTLAGFLASPQAACITGQIISINGGII